MALLFAAAFPFLVLPDQLADDTTILPKLVVTRGVVLVLVVLWVARSVTGGLRVHRTPLDIPLVAFVGSAALSTVLSVNPTLSTIGTYTRYEGLITIVTYALLFWILVQHMHTPQRARRLLLALLAGVGVECVLACVQALRASISGDLGDLGETSTTFGGVARALGTMGNANNLAILLAMCVPLILSAVVTVRHIAVRLLAGIGAALVVFTLAITFGRAAWLGATLGVVVTAVLSLSRAQLGRRALQVALGVAIIAVAVLGAGVAVAHIGVPVLGPLGTRLMSLFNPSAGSGGTRLHLYSDTVAMVAQRPLIGFGPDTFGLVYPGHEQGDWFPGVVVDKAHSDVLQVAAGQGALGVAAYVWMLVALFTALARGRGRAGVVAVLGGVVAYEVGIQLNFAWVPVTVPFWILLGAGVVLCGSTRVVEVQRLDGRAWLRGAVALACTAAAATAFVLFALRPALANSAYAAALNDAAAGERGAALQQISIATGDDPQEFAYPGYAGDLYDDVVRDRPGPDADLRGARAAYEQALADGDIYVATAVRLVYVDVALHDVSAAHAVADYARALAPFSPVTRLLAQELGG